jgi:hypothetical protein
MIAIDELNSLHPMPAMALLQIFHAESRSTE